MDDLLDCARFGELDDITLYIEHNSSSSDSRSDIVTRHGRGGNTMLHMAAANGHLHVAKYLVEICMCEPIRAHINAINEEGSTALHWAALNGQLEMVEFLLKYGADAKIKNSAGHTALYNAETNDQKEVVQKLLELTNYDDEEQEEDDSGATEEEQLPPNCNIRFEDDDDDDDPANENEPAAETQPNR